MSISKEELNEWKNYEVTKKIFDLVLEELNESIAQIASGRVVGETMDATAQEACRLSGRISGLSFLVELEEDADEQSS